MNTMELRLPALYEAADGASIGAQRRYLRLMKLHMATLIAGAVAGAISPQPGFFGQIVATTAAAALVAAVVTALIIQNKAYERTWYGARAVAESVKTLAWRYAARAEPFDQGGPDESDELLLKRFAEILQHGAALRIPLVGGGGPQITEEMRRLRELPLDRRREIYLTHRIADQRSWYGDRAAASHIAERKLFTAVWVGNGAAVAAALSVVLWSTLPVNATGILTTAAAAGVAWLQLLRHQELAQSYSTAAQELAMIHESGARVTTERHFAAFAADAESAISREHTLWVARRDAVV